MSSLYARLVTALLMIISMIGGGFYLIDRWATSEYYEELTQRLNSSIAMYVTGETTLIRDGTVNQPELKLLAERAMVINPTAEVYLLDQLGNVIGHALPPGSLERSQVDLEPVHALIAGEAQMPLRGIDPRSKRSKVFSAAEVTHDGQTEGYLYVVLGGQRYEELASQVRGSYVRTTSIVALVALVLVAFLAGLITFNLLTRRLSQLTQDVRDFAASGFDPSQRPQRRPTENDQNGDEIGKLSEAFVSMSDKINDQFEGLKETDRLRRELISNISHDLRTPLSSMRGYVDTLLLKNDQLSANQRQQYLRIARAHTLRLERMIGDLFELSKLESAVIQPTLETFSLAELVHDVAQQFSLYASRKKIRLVIQASNGNKPVVADIGLMQRVLENLIRNALKFTPSGGTITLLICSKPNAVTVTVADTGCGIPDEDLDYIFDRLYQTKAGQKSVQSTGLGLAIVKRILDLHGSQITVSSEVNRGTSFEFALPAVA